MRKIFNSVVGVPFLFLILPMTRRFRVCRSVGILYNTYMRNITKIRKPEVTGSNHAVGCNFNKSLTHSYFPMTKNKLFSHKVWGFLINSLYYSQELSVFRRNRNKSVLNKVLFKKLRFPKTPEKSL